MKSKNNYLVKLVSGLLALVVLVVVGLVSREDVRETKRPGTDTAITYSFRNEKLFHSHYQKHGAEFGDITQEEYLALANEVIDSSTALRKTEGEDGDTVVYEEKENYFLVLSTDGYIRTFFRPDDGRRYYDRQ